jgi:hypothetical protein
MRHILCAATLSFALGCAGRTYVTVADEAPPSPKLTDVLYKHQDGKVWIEGHYARSGTQWYWQNGRWENERAGHVWRDGAWEQRGSKWQWVPGEWIRARDGHVRVRGHWERRAGDQLVWVPGYWQKAIPGDTWEAGRWQPFGDQWIWRVGRWRSASVESDKNTVTDRTRKKRHR